MMLISLKFKLGIIIRYVILSCDRIIVIKYFIREYNDIKCKKDNKIKLIMMYKNQS